ncbi:hypothetical protein WCN91_07320 [Pseudoalteromonas sp. YIC-827]|uniref:Uncharacterized protein n=1 Tax=Pseudoalteromonas qingdaonensis TaxID=3131913 RepID=A0ABU9MY34_9GAMM
MRRIRVEVGNPETEEWGESSYIDLVPYEEVFQKQYPGLPSYPGIEDQLAVKDIEIDVAGEAVISIEAHHHIPKNSISIFVRYQGQSFVQATGTAIDHEGIGLSLLFTPPSSKVPVSLTCEA